MPAYLVPGELLKSHSKDVAISNFAEEINVRHDHLAKHQHTRIAVLPIHTVQERALYHALTKLESGNFGGP